MREALAARSDDDFLAEPMPPRQRPRAKGRGAPKESPAARAVAVLRRYPLETMIGAALAAAALAIVWNALALQTARHPAPFFSRKVDAPAPLPPARPIAISPVEGPAPVQTSPAPATVTTPQQAPRPAARDAIGDLIRSGPPAAPTSAAAPSAVKPPAPPTRPAIATAPAATVTAAQPDPIGDLIRRGDPPPVPPANVGRPDAVRVVASAQKALAKLNYLSAKPDGLMGPGTKQAIERFERDRKLPVTGELSGRTLRELEAASGLPID